MTLERYLQKRGYWEVAGVALLLLIGFAANVGIVLIEHGRAETGMRVWEAVALEGSSHIALALLLPLLLWFDRRFPFTTATWRRSALAHAVFTVPWSLAHVTLMYWMRVAVFPLLGGAYAWDDWPAEFAYEFLKDFRTYFFLLAVVYLYRFVLRRLQGEAGYLSEGEASADAANVVDRFLIKKLGSEFLVRVEEIDWIESSGNYVNLHVGKRVYPLRETMIGITERLQPQGFRRVHRSAIVNLDRVAEITPFDSGDGEARLESEVVVPISRRYRKELKEALGGTATA